MHFLSRCSYRVRLHCLLTYYLLGGATTVNVLPWNINTNVDASLSRGIVHSYEPSGFLILTISLVLKNHLRLIIIL